MNVFAFFRLARQAIGLLGKRATVILLLVAIMLSVLDLVGIAAVFPFVQFIYLDDKTRYLPSWLPSALREPAVRLNLIALSAFLLLFGAKTALQYLLSRVQAMKLARATARITEEFLSTVLGARFALFQSRPASELFGLCYSYPTHVGLVVLSICQLVTEAVFVAVAFSVLLAFEWRIALIASILLSMFGLLLLGATMRPIQRLAFAQRQLEAQRHRLFFAIANSVREIGVMGLAPVFKAKSERISGEIARVSGRYGVLAIVPRLSIELLFVFCVLALIVVLISLGYPADKAVPLMGVILVGAVRMVPAVSRSLAALSNIRFSAGFVRDLAETGKMLAAHQRPSIDDELEFNREIEIKGLGFGYGEKRILDNVSLKIPKGSYVSIVGRSGEGKSTLLDLFIGLQPKSVGTFLCDGKPFDPFSSRSFRRMIGYVPQAVTLFDDTLAFNVTLQQTPDRERLDRVLAAANLKDFVASLPQGVDSNLGENGIRTSGGQRQRIGIARALFRDPQLLILDEATSSLDTVTEANLSEEIQKLRGRLTILQVAHRLSTVQSSDCICVLSSGRIVEQGTHYQLLERIGLYSNLVSGVSEAIDATKDVQPDLVQN
jgi:ATP-binding cassette, subfamily B, bacterial PglK